MLAEVFGFDLGGTRLSTEPGMHRVIWDLRYPAPQMPPGAVIFGFPAGPMAVPGTYTATLSVGDWSQSHEFEVMTDPRIDTTVEQMRQQFDFLQRVADDLKQVGEQLTRLRSARSQMQQVVERLKAVDTDADVVAELESSAKETAGKLTALEEEMVQTKSRSFEDPLNYPGKLTAMLANVQAVANSGADAPPTDGSVEFLGQLEAQMTDIFDRLQAILDQDVAAFNARVSGLDLPAVVVEQE